MSGDAVALIALTVPVVVATSARLRWHLGRRLGPRRTPSAVELAMVAGGDDRALLAALAALRRAGALTALEAGLLLPVGPAPDGADQLQRAVHQAARANRELAPPREGAFGYGHGLGWYRPPAVRAAGSAVRRGVRRAGWIVLPPGSRPAGWGCLTAVVALALGAAYLGTMVVAARLWQLDERGFFRGPLPVLLLLGYVALGFSLADVPTRTRSGERLLRRARDTHRRLTPGEPVRTPEEAALSVALGGEAAFVALDPEFARRLGVTAAGSPTVAGAGDGDGRPDARDTYDAWPTDGPTADDVRHGSDGPDGSD